MNKLGLCSIALLDMPIQDVARLAAETGLDGIEVTARKPHLDRAEGTDAAQGLGDEIRGLGLDVLAYGSYYGAQGRYSDADAALDVELTAALSAPLLRVWAEPAGDGGPNAVVEGIRRIARLAAEREITVVIERHSGSFADTQGRVAALLDAIGETNVALNYQPLDFQPVKAYERLADDAKRLLPLSRYVHLKNYRLPDTKGANTVPWASLEDGSIDYRPVLAALAESYDGPISIEFLATDSRPAAARLAADVRFVRDVLGR
jgi:sugar phosphate isomerase/epimerase